jgi:sulfonate transport system substrate-binding protein
MSCNSPRAMKLFIGLLALCFAPLSAQAETVLKIGDQKGNARAVLEAAGALDNLTYKIEWREFSAAAPLLEAANAGAIDAGTVGDAPFIFAVASGIKVKAVAAVRASPAGLAVLVRKEAPFKSFKDLIGKRIATGRGSIGHQLILAELEKEGLTTNDVQIVFLLPADAGPALLQGSVDAWATWDPYVAQLELLKGARIIADGIGITPGLGYFIARREALDDQAKREALRDLTGRLAKARHWGNANFRDYSVIWSKVVGLPSEVGLKMLERQNAKPVLIDQSVISDEQKTIELYLRSGLISNHVDAASVIDPIFNDAIIHAGAIN